VQALERRVSYEGKDDGGSLRVTEASSSCEWARDGGGVAARV